MEGLHRPKFFDSLIIWSNDNANPPLRPCLLVFTQLSKFTGHRIEQQEFGFFVSAFLTLADTAWSNSSLTPSIVRAEHSRYRCARNSRAIDSPRSFEIGFCLCFCSLAKVFGSSLRSVWVATTIKGVRGECSLISGIHFILTFWNDAGETQEKQTRKMSVLS